MIKIAADIGKCEGYANCVVAAADVYDIDDDGHVVVLRSTVDDSERSRVAEAVRSCPAAAIWLEEE
ncbi:ferredoxin [Streptomyces sp. NPDC006872]|uniref:ferredoxin n=1 Tax=Streptomyces sp. NPDC006872 TaxID=3155720 RepID=UPI0033FD8EC1